MLIQNNHYVSLAHHMYVTDLAQLVRWMFRVELENYKLILQAPILQLQDDFQYKKSLSKSLFLSVRT